jgi:HAE1 family hydrophobic/amphiphilic exporter-1
MAAGGGIEESALEAARSRLRPILMTAFAFILGVMPLVTASGSGAISRQVLGTVVLGGMLAATCISIFMVPSTFSIVERLAHRASSRSEDAPGEEAP